MLANKVDMVMRGKIRRKIREKERELMELSSLIGEKKCIITTSEVGDNLTLEGTDESVMIGIRGKVNDIINMKSRVELGEGNSDLSALKETIKVNGPEVKKQEMFFNEFFRDSLRGLHDRYGYWDDKSEEDWDMN
jgi:hypothetical protein